jgi:Zn-dependent metalloprotease
LGPTDFAPGQLEPDKQLNFAHVRLPQVYKGIPVFGRQLLVHLDTQEQITAVNGHFAHNLNVPTQPTIAK